MREIILYINKYISKKEYPISIPTLIPYTQKVPILQLGWDYRCVR